MSNSKKDPAIHIFREVTPESSDGLQFVGNIAYEFPQKTISPRTRKLLTIIGAWDFHFPPTNRRSLSRTEQSGLVIYPIPETAWGEQSFDVSGVDFFDYNVGTRGVGVELDDPEGILEGEYRTYMERMGQVVTEEFRPHVKIATVADTPKDATADVLSWVKENVPPRIRVGGIQSFPKIAPPTASVLSRVNAPPVEHTRTPKPAPRTVANINRVQIPQSMIDAMKRNTES